MFTRTALIAALTLGTVAVASAQEFDPNLANRYPAYAGPVAAKQTFHSSNVALRGASYLDQASQTSDAGGR